VNRPHIDGPPIWQLFGTSLLQGPISIMAQEVEGKRYGL
jgi:hypothetical protein